MARNPVQFQKGISLNAVPLALRNRRAVLRRPVSMAMAQRVSCARTAATTDAASSPAHKLQQCYRCNRQTSITAGTIFEATKLPLTVWFQGIYLMTQDKKGVIGDEAAPPSRHLLQRGVAHADTS